MAAVPEHVCSKVLANSYEGKYGVIHAGGSSGAASPCTIRRKA